jgi:hypothetical protein
MEEFFVLKCLNSSAIISKLRNLISLSLSLCNSSSTSLILAFGSASTTDIPFPLHGVLRNLNYCVEQDGIGEYHLLGCDAV